MWPFKKTVTDLFADLPGPSPWYLKSGGSPIPGYKWVSKGMPDGDGGKTYLCKNKEVFLIVDFQHYVMPLSDSQILIWHQRQQDKELVSPPLEMIVLDIKNLNPIRENLDKLCAKMKNDKIGLIYDGKAIAETELSTIAIDEPLSVISPPPISDIDELLIFCHSSGIGISNGWDKQNLALMVIHPSKFSYQIYPQDWFNNGSYDFG